MKESSNLDSFIHQTDNSYMEPLQIAAASCSDISVDVKHCDSSITEKDYETLSSISCHNETTILGNDCCDHRNTDSSRQFHDCCLQELMETQILSTLITKLDKSKNLQDFMTLLRHLASGSIPMNNIVLLLMLE